MKRIVLLLLLLFTTLQVSAQITKSDSVTLKIKTAVADDQYFKLDKQTWKAFRKHGINYNSDYFKPTTINTIDAGFLTDLYLCKGF